MGPVSLLWNESDERQGLCHIVVGTNRGVRGPPSRPHHCQNVQECYILAFTPRLINCLCDPPFQFVLETNLSPPDASNTA